MVSKQCIKSGLGSIAVLSMALATGEARGAALIDLNFDSNSTGTLIGQSANATGLTGTWSQSSTSIAPVVTSGNLAFSSLNPSGTGNRLVVTSTAAANFRAQIDLAGTSPFTGTLWSGGIFKITDVAAGTGPAEMTRINATSGGTGDSSWLRNWIRGQSATAHAVGYDNGVSTSAFTPTTGTTYLMISRFTNAGIAAAGVGESFLLTESQYNAFLAEPDGFTAADLTAANVTAGKIAARAVDNVANASALTIADTNYLMSTGFGSAGDPFGVEYDRIVFADSFDTVVPEPASLSLLAIAGASLLRRRRS